MRSSLKHSGKNPGRYFGAFLGISLGLPFLSAVPSIARSAPLSWQDCVDLASKNNPEVQAARATMRAAEYQKGVARSGLFPQVSGNLGYNRSNSTVSLTSTDITGAIPGGGNITTSSSNYTATVSATETLFSGLQDIGKMAQADANFQASAESLQITIAKVSYDLKSAFEALRFAKEYKTLTTEIIRRRQENLQLVQLHFESGLENKGSVLLSQANLKQAQYDDLQAKNSERVAQVQLAKTLGIDDSSIDIAGEVPTRNPKENETPDFKSLAVNTPEFKQARAQEQSSDAAITVARSGFFPSLSLSASTGQQGPHFFPDSRSNWSVGVNITVPITSGGKDYFGTLNALETWKSSAANTQTVSRQTLFKLEQSYAAYVEAIAKLGVDESFRDATSVRAEIARKKYNNGLISFEDWTLIEDDLISRQKTYLSSKRDRVVSEAAWDQTVGKGVIQ